MIVENQPNQKYNFELSKEKKLRFKEAQYIVLSEGYRTHRTSNIVQTLVELDREIKELRSEIEAERINGALASNTPESL